LDRTLDGYFGRESDKSLETVVLAWGQELADSCLRTVVWGQEFGDRSLGTGVWGQTFGDRSLGTGVWGQAFADRRLQTGVCRQELRDRKMGVRKMRVGPESLTLCQLQLCIKLAGCWVAQALWHSGRILWTRK
jgi:hypothetical protein